MLSFHAIYLQFAHLICWKRYADDTSCFIKNDSNKYAILVLNSFHPLIRLKYETENSNSISFLNTELLHVGENIEKIFFRKPTNTNLYIHWQPIAPLQRKHSTLKSSYSICSNEKHLHSKFKNLRRVFQKVWEDFTKQHREELLPDISTLIDVKNQMLFLP